VIGAVVCASDGDDDFSSRVTIFQIADSLWHCAQRIRPVDHRRDLACLDKLLQDLQVLLASFRKKRAKPLANVPTPPDAPMIRTFCPDWIRP